MTLGERIQNFREARGWSTQQLARAAQLREQYLLEIESSAVVPHSRTLQKIADSLDVSLDAVLGNEVPKEVKPIEELLSPNSALMVQWITRLVITAGVLTTIALGLLVAAYLLELSVTALRPALATLI